MDDSQPESTPSVGGELDTTQDAENIALRIAKLNEIEQNVAKLLRSAGMAIRTLSDTSQSTFDEAGNSRKEAFTKHTRDYFEAVSFVDVNLRRQILALEEAGIISAQKENSSFGSSKDSGPTQPSQETAVPSTQETGISTASTRSGLGNLDIGWLNSQSDQVGKQKELELWKEAERLIQKTMANLEGRDHIGGEKEGSTFSTPGS